MRIIHLGVDPRTKVEPPWWDGMRVSCACGTILELELYDRWSHDLDSDHGVIKLIRVYCPVCSNIIKVERPAAVPSLRKFEANRDRVAESNL